MPVVRTSNRYDNRPPEVREARLGATYVRPPQGDPNFFTDPVAATGAAFGHIGDGWDAATGGIGNPFDNFGESDFHATVPPTTPYWNPAVGPGGVINNPNVTPYRDDVREAAFAPDRAAPQTGGVQLGYVPPATGSTIDTSMMDPGNAVTAVGLGNSEGTRAFQTANLLGLGAAAMGAVPSAAEVQQRRATDANLKSNLALAASARGTAANQAAARRTAIDSNTSQQLQAAAQASQLRAQEQAVARQQFTDALGGIRSSDLATAGIGTTVSGQGLQAATAQLGSDTQTGIANLQSGTQQALGQLNADQSIQLANLDAQLRSRGMDDNARIAYLGQLVGIDTTTAEGQQKAQQMYIQAIMQAQQINSGVSLANAGVAPQLLGAGLSAGGAILGAAVGA